LTCLRDAEITEFNVGATLPAFFNVP